MQSGSVSLSWPSKVRDDDDTRILLCLNEIWIAAERKGYTVEDLQTVLRLLGSPQ